MSRHFSCLLSSILVTTMLFMSRHNSDTSSRTSQAMSWHKNPLSRHSSVFWFSLCRNIHFFVVTFLSQSFSYYVVTKFEMSQKSLNFQLKFNFVFVGTYHSLLQHCPVGCLERLLRHYEIMSQHFYLSQFFCYFSCWICFFYIQNLQNTKLVIIP